VDGSFVAAFMFRMIEVLGLRPWSSPASREDRVTGAGEVGCEGSAAGTGAYDDVFISAVGW
jgi:hypothetical protein